VQGMACLFVGHHPDEAGFLAKPNSHPCSR
jgi:hypothetical protein